MGLNEPPRAPARRGARRGLMRTPWMVLCLLLLFFSVALAGQPDKYPTIDYKRADDHIGEIVWVEGTVLKTEKKPEGMYLLFHNNDRYVRVLIPEKDLGNFEGSFKYMYVGKEIKAIGKVQEYGSKLILGVNEPKRIKVIEEAT
jgi:hypothetical protein